MNTATFTRSAYLKWFTFAAAITCFLCVSAATIQAQDQILSEPVPSPSTNGALHYNRALLLLSVIDLEKRELLSKPLLEAVGQSSKEELRETLAEIVYEGRHAIRAAAMGSRQDNADFGIDFLDYGLGGNLPHVQPMLQLGRLVTLAAIHAQIEEDWKKAGFLYFHGLNIGQHMTHQPTLLECMAGLEILEGNYYALAHWAAKCPDRALLSRAFLRLEMKAPLMVKPSETLAHEASIFSGQCEKVKASFPDGAWAEMLLEAMGEYTSADSAADLEKKAIEICAKRGIPSGVFQNKSEFDAHLDKVRQLHVRYLELASVCMNLPPLVCADRGKRIYERYQVEFKKLGARDVLDPSEFGRSVAIHSAELTMARVVVALAASKTEGRFPAKLEDVAAKFAGTLPKSPYDNSPLEYTVTSDGQRITLTVPEAAARGVTMPKIEFNMSGDAS